MSQKLLPAVFDLDDVCFGLNPRASEFTGIPLYKLSEFKVFDNQNLTPLEQQAVWDAYHNVELFRDIDFYLGFDDLLRLRQIGIDPFIKTNSFSVEIADLKLEQIRAHLPNLPQNHIIMNIIDEKTSLRKDIDESIFAFIDDSPYNIAKSRAQHNVVPMWPLNQTPRAQAMMLEGTGKRPFQVEPGNLYTIYALLEHLIKTIDK